MARPKTKAPWLGARNGIFYAHWYDDTNRVTRRLSLRTGDKDEAENRFAAFLVEGRDIRKPPAARLTVSEALDQYFEEHVLQNVVDKDRQRDIIRHLKAFFGDRAIEDVDIPMSRAYAHARYAGEIGGGKRRKVKAGSQGTVRRELTTLTSAANHAMRWKRLKALPSVELPREKRLGVDDEAPYFSYEEVDALTAAADGELRLFVQLAYLTGARRRSLEDMHRSQVKWNSKRILLQKPGKMSTKKRQPIVPILRAMEAPLRKLWDTGGDPRLFVCADFYRPFRDLALSVGIDDARAHPHTLRHTRATHLLLEGKSIYDVAKLLGDTVSTIERVYGHHSHEHLAKNLED
jgi:integrase